MTFPFLPSREAARRRRRGVPRDLPPYLMRDIGLPPWPEPPRIPSPPLW